jgi:hypothetical protein
MVKKIALFFLYTFVFLVALVAFFPKESVYYKLEKELKPYGIVISHEQLIPHFLSLELKDLEVSVQGVQGGEVEDVTITLLGLYNTLEVRNIQLSSMAKSFLPLRVEKLALKHSCLDLFNLKIEGNGEFGVVEATLNIQTRKLHLVLQPSKEMKNHYRSTLRMLKKEKNGEYVYDQVLK